MSGLRLCADELTRALDAGAAFTGALGPLAVALHPAGRGAIRELGVRDADEGAARAAGRAAGPGVAAATCGFLKIDSVLRGPWAAPTAGALVGGGFDRAILVPAFPAQGRITEGGRQWLVGPGGARAPSATEPLPALAAAGLLAAAWDGAAVAPAADVLLCDAASDAALARVAGAGRALPGRTLWVGAAGLAGALAGVPAAQAAPASGRRLVVVGTRGAPTLAQVAALPAAFPGADGLVSRDPPAAREPLLLRFPLPEATTAR